METANRERTGEECTLYSHAPASSCSIENHNIIRFNLGGIKSKMSNGSKYKNSPTWKSGSKQ